MRTLARGAVLLFAAVAVSCSSNPSAPSSTAASISGTVRLSTAARAATNAGGTSLAMITLKVGVKGTSVGTSTNSNGQFTLNGVPAGNVTLVFQGDGVNAQLPLGTLQPGDRVTITVSVNGSNATLEDREDDHDDENENEQNGHEVEGAISGLGSTIGCPTLSFTIGNITVNTNSNTKFDDVQCTALTNGMKIEVKGTLVGNVLTATRIEKD